MALLWELDYLIVLLSKGSEANRCVAFWDCEVFASLHLSYLCLMNASINSKQKRLITIVSPASTEQITKKYE